MYSDAAPRAGARQIELVPATSPVYSSSRAILNVEPSTTHRLRDTNAAGGGGGNGGPTRRQSLCAMGASMDILSALLWIFFDGPASVFIFPLHH